MMQNDSALARARHAVRITQAELAARVGCNRVSISNIERGQQSPHMGLALRIAREVGSSAEALFADLDARREPEPVESVDVPTLDLARRVSALEVGSATTTDLLRRVVALEATVRRLRARSDNGSRDDAAVTIGATHAD